MHFKIWKWCRIFNFTFVLKNVQQLYTIVGDENGNFDLLNEQKCDL